MIKKLSMTLPVVGVIIALFGTAVFAATPEPGSDDPSAEGKLVNIVAVSSDGTDVSNNISVGESDRTEVLGLSLTELEVSGFTPDSSKGFKEADYVVVDVFDVSYVDGGVETEFDGTFDADRVFSSSPKDDVVTFHYNDGVWEQSGTGDGTLAHIHSTSLSPFIVAKASVNTSAPAGQYASPYIIMIAVALIALGAIIIIRAKKA
jgi:hypothetical protein